MSKSDAIKMVLGKLIELYDVDTSVIWPDDCLSEAGITNEMSQRVLVACLNDLGVNGFEVSAKQGPPTTARMIVEIVYSHSQSRQMSESKMAS